MARPLTEDQIRRLRARAQRLEEPLSGGSSLAARVAREVCGIQAQDLPAAALSVRVRASGITAADLTRARVSDRSIVRTWCMRGTLHLLAAEDFGWLLPLLGPIFIARSQGRYLQLGLTGDVAAAGLRRLQNALASRGPMTREEIAAELAAQGLPAGGQAPVHLIGRAALDGILCQGPDRGAKQTYVLVRDWIKPEGPLPREEALAELARRYLAAFSPARPEDLAAWSGLGAGEARQAWSRIAAELLEVEASSRPAWMLKAQVSALDEAPPAARVVRLLPRFDTYLLGYASRDLVVPPAQAKRINRGGGIIHPTLLVDGRVLGTWSTRKRGRNHLDVAADPFDRLAPEVVAGLETETAEIGRFLGVEAGLSILEPHTEESRA